MACFDNWEAYKGRTIDVNKPVRVYRNLHRNCYSVQQDRLVIGHCSSFLLNNFSFLVNETGRRKVIREKQKNIHAYVTGYVVRNLLEGKLAVPQILTQGNVVTYNPYKYSDFVYLRSERVVDNTQHMYVYGNHNGLRVF